MTLRPKATRKALIAYMCASSLLATIPSVTAASDFPVIVFVNPPPPVPTILLDNPFAFFNMPPSLTNPAQPVEFDDVTLPPTFLNNDPPVFNLDRGGTTIRIDSRASRASLGEERREPATEERSERGAEEDEQTAQLIEPSEDTLETDVPQGVPEGEPDNPEGLGEDAPDGALDELVTEFIVDPETFLETRSNEEIAAAVQGALVRDPVLINKIMTLTGNITDAGKSAAVEDGIASAVVTLSTLDRPRQAENIITAVALLGNETFVLNFSEKVTNLRADLPEGELGADGDVLREEDVTEGEVPDGEEGADGNIPDGEEGADGGIPDGELGADADIPDGELGADGEIPVGELGADGDIPDGELGADGQTLDAPSAPAPLLSLSTDAISSGLGDSGTSTVSSSTGSVSTTTNTNPDTSNNFTSGIAAGAPSADVSYVGNTLFD